MKIIIGVIAMMMSLSALGESQEYWKELLFDKAKANESCNQANAKEVIRRLVEVQNIPKETVLKWALEYQANYKINPQVLNLLDAELRNIKSLNYWTGYKPVKKEELPVIPQPTETSILGWIKQNWQWLALGAGLLIAGPYIVRLFRKKD